MEKITTILILLALGIISGCTISNKHEYINNEYHSREIPTHVTSQEFWDIVWRDFTNQEFERIKPQLRFDSDHIIEIRKIIPNTQSEYYDQTYNNNPASIEQEYTMGRFVSRDSVYHLQWSPSQPHFYSLYKNNNILVSRSMLYGAESAIEEFIILTINNQKKEGFTFYDYESLSGYETLWATRNTRYDGQTMNELYDLDESSFLFNYNNKIGFVAGKNNKKFVIYNGKQVSEFYDEILTYSCCAMYHYPLQIDQNGLFLFLAKKGKNYPFVEIDLDNK